MHYYTRSLTFIGLLWLGSALIFSCQNNTIAEELIGEWEAVSVVEEQDSLPLNPSEIGFLFTSSNRYRYRSTLNYQEAGLFRVKNNLLFTTDTLEEKSAEKAVEVAYLSTDSLVLRMKQEEKERLLTLVRK